MDDLDKLYSRVGFKDEAMYELLRNAVLDHLSIAQFVVYRTPLTYEELKRATKDFAAVRVKTARSAAQVGRLRICLKGIDAFSYG